MEHMNCEINQRARLKNFNLIGDHVSTYLECVTSALLDFYILIDVLYHNYNLLR